MDWRNRKLINLQSRQYLFIFLTTAIAVVYSSTAVTEGPTGAATLPGLVDNTSSTASAPLTNTTSAPTSTSIPPPDTTPDTAYLDKCPDGAACKDLGANCINCLLNHYCVYGEVSTGNCTVKPNITCTGDRSFVREYECRYGYQLSRWQYDCDNLVQATSCTVKSAPLEGYTAQCTVKENVLCLGNRTFHKKFPCNWTSGYKWSTALVLSVTLGGFGVDRFYLGLWREGIGKLFSFGGLGVWTILDVILIAVGYVGPHDGSLFIYPWD